MNRKLSQSILAFAVIFLSVSMAYSQSGSQFSGSGGFNRQGLLFENSVAQGMQVLGQQRLLVLTSAGLGVSLNKLNADFQAADMPLSRLIVAEMVAHSAGVQVDNIITLFNKNASVFDVMHQFRVPKRVIKLRLKGFAEAINNEVGIISGSPPVEQEINKEFNLASTDLANSFDQVNSMFTVDASFSLLFRVLSFDTGFTVAQVASFHDALSSDITASQFTRAIIAASMINSVSSTDLSSVTFLDNNLLTDSGVTSSLNSSKIPVVLLSSRMETLAVDLSVASVEGSPILRPMKP